MKKAKIAILLCAAMTMSLAAGAVTTYAEETSAKVLNIGWPYEPSTLDPARAVEDASYRILRMTGEALLRNVENEAEPGCAESYEVTDDHMEYVFHLREDNAFSDGTPITANDFKYTLERLLNAEGAYEGASTGYIIKNAEKYYNGECDISELGIEVVDDYTLKLTLEYPTYPITFTNWAFIPVSEAKSDELGVSYGAEAENMLTNGPFTVASWVHDSEVVLEKNPNYWNADAVNLDQIVCKLNAKGDTAVDMLLAGELDMANMDSQMQADTLTSSGFIAEMINNGLEELHINHTGKTEETGLFLSNTNFRKALNYAIDRDALVAAAYTTDQATTRFISSTEAGVEGTFQEEYPYEGWTTSADAEKAQECLNAALEELGKTADEIPTFTMMCYDSNTNMIALNAIMDMWNKTLGINCEIDAQPIQNMIQKAYAGDYDFWKGAIATSTIDALDLFNYYTTSDGMFNYSNEEYDSLYNATRDAVTWQERKDNMFELEQLFCEEVVDLVITWPGEYVVYSENVTGATMDMVSVDVTFADITE
ncbi:MAG: peptide ABC transporter substrate-binding protein [Eubacteriales bacterium]|nr:peptide ABC transporter substrate-binding protein [Eubacteriales bacterium]